MSGFSLDIHANTEAEGSKIVSEPVLKLAVDTPLSRSLALTGCCPLVPGAGPVRGDPVTSPHLPLNHSDGQRNLVMVE